jgi:alkylation response protein AidB-like acyl-CoA dehydrogenase
MRPGGRSAAAPTGGTVDFTFSPDEERFRADLRAFLQARLPAGWSDRAFLGDVPPDEHQEVAAAIRSALADRRWLALGWPEDLGGLAAGPIQQAIQQDEAAYLAMPGAVDAGVQWVGPAIQLFGSDAQRQTYLPRIAGGRDTWCTLYSEPGAGSDLAALQTRAVRDGDEYVINGSKIWAAGAGRASHGWLAARTDPAAPHGGASRHRGLSTFIVPMDTPGVSVRPLVDMDGGTDLAEVFFEDARIPATNLVGVEGRGWYQVTETLDRARSGIEAFAEGKANLERLVAAAKDERSLIAQSPNARYEIADRWIELEVGYQVAYRVPYLQAQGEQPNHEASVSKLYGSELTQRIANTGMHLLGMASQVAPGSPYARLGGAFARLYTRAAAATITGGPSEVQRNVIAQRGLGLPRS